MAEPLRLLSVVIPARDEEACIASTVEHLHLELRLHGIPHEIVVVDDGSSDGTWKALVDLQQRVPPLRPLQNPGPHGFGRAIAAGFDHMAGEAVVVMIAGESDDCRDVVRYWETLNVGYKPHASVTSIHREKPRRAPGTCTPLVCCPSSGGSEGRGRSFIKCFPPCLVDA